LPCRNDDVVDDGVGDFEESVTGSVRYAGGDQEKAGESEAEKTSDDGGVYLSG